MKWLAGLFVALLALGIAGAIVYRHMGSAPKGLDLARQKLTAHGLYRVAIEPESPVDRNTIHSWIVAVSTPDGGVVGDATILVDGGMPQHGHGLPTAPKVSDHIGDGRYRVEGVRFNMGGWWVLKFTVKAPAGEDTVEFNLMM